MKTKKPNVTSCPQTTTALFSKTSKLLLGSLGVAAALPLASTSALADETNAVAVTPPPPQSRVNWLVNVEFSDKYLTPRGMVVQNEGLVIQPLILGFANVYKGDNFLNSVTLVGGVWNCFGTETLPSSSGSKTDWYEIDPIAGVSVGFAKNFTLDVTYTAFQMQIFNIPFSQHLETKLSFNDSSYLKAFAVHPYISYWQELNGKAVANTDKSPSESYYFDIGIAPSFTIPKVNVKLEAPCRMLLAGEDFYGTGAGGGSTVGLYELGMKATVPLSFMPQGYGHWSFHAGFKYMDFLDKNLIATQGQSDVWQAYGGISIFF